MHLADIPSPFERTPADLAVTIARAHPDQATLIIKLLRHFFGSFGTTDLSKGRLEVLSVSALFDYLESAHASAIPGTTRLAMAAALTTAAMRSPGLFPPHSPASIAFAEAFTHARPVTASNLLQRADALLASGELKPSTHKVRVAAIYNVALTWASLAGHSKPLDAPLPTGLAFTAFENTALHLQPKTFGRYRAQMKAAVDDLTSLQGCVGDGRSSTSSSALLAELGPHGDGASRSAVISYLRVFARISTGSGNADGQGWDRLDLRRIPFEDLARCNVHGDTNVAYTLRYRFREAIRHFDQRHPGVMASDVQMTTAGAIVRHAQEHLTGKDRRSVAASGASAFLRIAIDEDFWVYPIATLDLEEAARLVRSKLAPGPARLAVNRFLQAATAFDRANGTSIVKDATLIRSAGAAQDHHGLL